MLSGWKCGTEEAIGEGVEVHHRFEGLVCMASSLRVYSGADRKDHENNCEKKL